MELVAAATSVDVDPDVANTVIAQTVLDIHQDVAYLGVASTDEVVPTNVVVDVTDVANATSVVEISNVFIYIICMLSYIILN